MREIEKIEGIYIMDNRPIGLLDSGVGGLTVVKKIIQEMPGESTVFIGDNAHIPYGDKTKEEIVELTRNSVNFLLSKNVKLIIFACNTATAVAMDIIQKEITVPIIGVIQSGSSAAIRATQTNRVAVVATQMTVALHAYQTEINARDPKVQVTELAAPQLVPLIEKNAGRSNYLSALQQTLKPLENSTFDTLILGCTHYPIIRDEFVQCLPTGVQVVDPADQVAESTFELMKQKGLLGASNQAAQHEYYTTGEVELVEKLGKIVLNDANFTAHHL